MNEGDDITVHAACEVDTDIGDRGLMDLFGQLASDAREVARAEIGLVKARAFDTADRYKTAAILFAAAGTLGLAALIALLVGLILTLKPHVGAGWATMIVVGATVVVTTILGLMGKARLSAASTR